MENVPNTPSKTTGLLSKKTAQANSRRLPVWERKSWFGFGDVTAMAGVTLIISDGWLEAQENLETGNDSSSRFSVGDASIRLS